MKGENLGENYLRVNPWGMLPSLELDDGTIIPEAPCIFRYLESMHPEPNLLGEDPKESASIQAWERFAEMSGMQAMGEAFRNQTQMRQVIYERGFEQLGDVGAVATNASLDAQPCRAPGAQGEPDRLKVRLQGQRQVAELTDPGPYERTVREDGRLEDDPSQASPPHASGVSSALRSSSPTLSASATRSSTSDMRVR